MPGPAPPVVNGLQIDQSLDFQRRFQRVQTVAWRVLALLPVAAVAGLFGGGLFSQATAGGDGVTASYDRFGRRSVDTQLKVTVMRARPPATVSISREFLDRYRVSEIRPLPGLGVPPETGAGRGVPRPPRLPLRGSGRRERLLHVAAAARRIQQRHR